MNNALKIKDLHYKYHDKSEFTLNISELELAEKDSLAIFGKSGSGKSTLIKICAMLQNGFSGEIFLFGENILQPEREKRLEISRKIAILFQDAPIFDASVFDNIAIGLKIRHTPRETIKNEVESALEALNLKEIKNAHAREISGGQARRVCLARVLALKPSLIFLDEPFHSLDSINKFQIMKEYKALIKSAGITSVIITHDKYEALGLAKRMAVIEKGTIIQQGSVSECFRNPVSREAAMLGGRNMIYYGEATSYSNELSYIKCSMPYNAKSEISFFAAAKYQPGDKICVMISPDDVSIHPADSSNETSSALNHYRGRITSFSHYEFGMMIAIATGSGAEIESYITNRSFERLNLELGTEINVSIKATSIKTFPLP